jgi:hypothetical protein
MEQENKNQPLNLKKLTAIYLALLHSDNQKIQIQLNINHHGQFSSNIQHKQKIRGNEPVQNNQKIWWLMYNIDHNIYTE